MLKEIVTPGISATGLLQVASMVRSVRMIEPRIIQVKLKCVLIVQIYHRKNAWIDVHGIQMIMDVYQITHHNVRILWLQIMLVLFHRILHQKPVRIAHAVML